MLGAKLAISQYLSVVCREIEKLDPAQIEKVCELVEAAYDEGRFVFIMRQRRIRRECFAPVRGSGEVHPSRLREPEAAQSLEPDRQHRRHHGLGQRRRV